MGLLHLNELAQEMGKKYLIIQTPRSDNSTCHPNFEVTKIIENWTPKPQKVPSQIKIPFCWEMHQQTLVKKQGSSAMLEYSKQKKIKSHPAHRIRLLLYYIIFFIFFSSFLAQLQRGKRKRDASRQELIINATLTSLISFIGFAFLSSKSRMLRFPHPNWEQHEQRRA